MVITLSRAYMKPELPIIKKITGLGLSGFIMSVTNGSVQIMCNATLQHYGGDLYVGIMTVINSVREIITMPANGLTNGAQPVMSYNYGAGEYRRVKSAIKFTPGRVSYFPSSPGPFCSSSHTFSSTSSTAIRS